VAGKGVYTKIWEGQGFGETLKTRSRNGIIENEAHGMVIDWRDYIHSDPEILIGKPVIKGTRLSVEFLLGLFAEGWSDQQILENYPTLDRCGLKAVFAFAAECLREEALYSLPGEAV
jgi:uncharacterized protein (DUF433 family)